MQKCTFNIDAVITLLSEATTLGLATGGTMLPLYEAMRKDPEAWADKTTFNLDEYYPIEHDDPQSYHAYMKKELLDHVPVQQWDIPDGEADDPDTECERYENAISAAGGIDIQVLGIGSNGHIGFNEPGTSFDSRTHVVILSEQTRKDNARFFPDGGVPVRAITMGLATIMEARKIILIATGKNKAEAVQKMLEGPITEDVPASILQRHPDCTVFLDEEAAALLEETP